MIRLLTITVLLCAFLTAPVSAHVLLRNEEETIGAVFHANPEDDPIAGQRSELYFDIQDKNSSVRIPYDGYDLFITNEAGEEVQVETGVSDSTIIAGYTFPSQGLYIMTLRSQPKYDEIQKIVLTDSIRVTRGVVGAGTVPDETHDTAEILLIASGTLFLVLGVTAFNNRRAIIAKSKF